LYSSLISPNEENLLGSLNLRAMSLRPRFHKMPQHSNPKNANSAYGYTQD